MTTHRQRICWLALAGLLCAPQLATQTQLPPGSAEQSKLIRSFFELDSRRAEDRAQQREILARLDSVPPLTANSVKSWHKKLIKEKIDICSLR